MSDHDFDVLVIGTGAAGLTAALNLAERFKVGVLAKGKLGGGATEWAQGGIAAVLEDEDSFENHIRDTMIAGAGLNDRDVVEMVVQRAPAAIEKLAKLGVPFNLDTDGDWHLTREGGHSHRRIVHVHDATGWAVAQALEKAAVMHENITLLPGRVAIDFIQGRHAQHYSTSGTVHGVYALDRAAGEVETITARATVLAAGGAGRAYQFSTAPRGATGDGIAMAWRAGCRVSNMEFMQFHPTCLYNLEVKNFLITEAVRGEGGILVNPTSGERFMKNYDERLELAPRDVVARAIDAEIKRDGLDYVHLDISHRGPDFVREHFPTIYDKLIGLGIDITKQPIPVVPAQHYTCGGVVVDMDGRTDAPGLYAAGEVTMSGLHGANRLASNSLLECFVYGDAAAEHIKANWDSLPRPIDVRDWDESRVTDSDEEVVIQQVWGEIRRFMWNFVGIVRTTKRLERAKARIDLLRQEVDDYYKNFRVTPDLIELRSLVEVADLIVRCALKRHESRGLHYTLDYPETDSVAQDTVLAP
ncbi:L-aspartate oxidase [Sphingomicrobium aestuariivivum]|uniref:L-aspartate oxidase n=1 Tax=Sphingomicrobium aestuariivivum TaxID=1582356 RepID=UPI001FD711F2|nr:L-aspartate oxidase [Sphingomicrobium aestuariivivum]MCJ8191103.1 L-aspartate oxidase [Sphingomicrobium aestuariivivum]